MNADLRRRATFVAVILAALVGVALPASQAAPQRPSGPNRYGTTTTTTTAPKTTTTAAPTTTTTAPTTTTTAPPAAPTCGDQLVAKASGGYWQCSFDDEFDGTSLDTTKWVVQQTKNGGYHSGQECFVDSPNNVSVANGTLSLTVRKEAAAFTCADGWLGYWTQYTSGMVSTWGLFSQAYGRFEIRAKVPSTSVPGLQEALWLWPATQTYGAWPASGEIDIAEMYSQYADRAIPYVHYNAATTDPNVTNNYCMLDLTQFHTYTLEWTTTSLTVSYDGRTCIVDTWNPAWPLTHPQPFDKPFIVALTQALGIGSNSFDGTKTPLPATTQVDYVRVWR